MDSVQNPIWSGKHVAKLSVSLQTNPVWQYILSLVSFLGNVQH
jgi:hypothetical protein